MSDEVTVRLPPRFLRRVSLIGLLLLLVIPAALRAQDEFDEYKIPFDAGWFYSNPSGNIRPQGDTVPVDFKKDLNFSSYSTFASSPKISAAAQVTADGTHQAAVSASKSLLAPIPVVGPQFCYYLNNSPRIFIDGNLYEIYLFGYGSFVSAAGDIGFTLTKRITANAGYQLGSRLNVNGTSSRIGLDWTQKGPLIGPEFSF
jgi:hypothetical protein